MSCIFHAQFMSEWKFQMNWLQLRVFTNWTWTSKWIVEEQVKEEIKNGNQTNYTTKDGTHFTFYVGAFKCGERERKKIVVLRIKFPNGMVYTWWLRWKTVAPYAYRLLHFYGTYSGNWIRASKVISIYCFVGEWHFACIINQRTLVRHTLIVYIIPVQFTSVLMRTNTKWEKKKIQIKSSELL